MLEQFEQIGLEALDQLKAVTNPAQLEEFRVKYLGRKGELTSVLRGLKDLAPEDRSRVGAGANKLKRELENHLEGRPAELEASGAEAAGGLDVTLPGRKPWVGLRYFQSMSRRRLGSGKLHQPLFRQKRLHWCRLQA